MSVADGYDVILADPPWRYKVYDRATGLGKSADNHYGTLPFSKLCRLDIFPLMAENCALFLWVTDWLTPAMIDRLLRSWSGPRKKDQITYRTRAWVWVKTTKTGKEWHWGTGYYTRANPEDCLLAVRGSMPVADRGVLRIIKAPVRAHSQKPDEQYEMIERLYPGARYLELFARHRREGWHAWGNEVDSDIDLAAERG